MTKLTGLTCLFLAVIGLSIGLMMQHSDQLSSLTTQPSGMDAFFNHIHYKTYTETGRLKNDLSAQSMRHYPQQNRSIFTRPHMVIFNSTHSHNAPWIITAARGNSVHGSNRIDLYGHVTIVQTAIANTAKTTILTSQLTFYPQQSQATSQQLVTIKRPGITMIGIGLRANLNTGVTQLLSHIRSRYAPQYDAP